jgi:hypothetical protein
MGPGRHAAPLVPDLKATPGLILKQMETGSSAAKPHTPAGSGQAPPQRKVEIKSCGECSLCRETQKEIDCQGYGLCVTLQPSYAYTVGLHEMYDLPELILVAKLPPLQLGMLISAFVGECKKNPALWRGEGFVVNTPPVIVMGEKAAAFGSLLGYEVVRPEFLNKESPHALVAAVDRYGPQAFRARQLVLSDPAGRLPWDPGFDQEWAHTIGQVGLYTPPAATVVYKQ